MDAEIGYGIMTYPARLLYARKLAQEIGGADIVLDREQKGALWNSLQTWEKLQHYSWAVLLQDDVIPCSSFKIAVEKLVQIFPDRCISLYNRQPNAEKYSSFSFFELDFYQWGQAWLMPGIVVRHMLLWIRKNLKPTPFSDPSYAIYMYRNNVHPLVCNPSLVDHNREIPSSKFNIASKDHAWYLCKNGDAISFQNTIHHITKTADELDWLRGFERGYLRG
jgi:hypothetical protein